jgi:hypothetical protein
VGGVAVLVPTVSDAAEPALLDLAVVDVPGRVLAPATTRGRAVTPEYDRALMNPSATMAAVATIALRAVSRRSRRRARSRSAADVARRAKLESLDGLSRPSVSYGCITLSFELRIPAGLGLFAGPLISD